MRQITPDQQPKPIVSPRGGPPASEVVLTMAGLPPLQSVSIGFGSLSQYEVIRRVEADEAGSLTTSLRLPSWAEVDRIHFIVVSLGRGRRILSDPFHVTDADGVARIVGTIEEDATTCLALVGPGDTRYALHGNIARWSPGLRVQVVGTVAEGPECGLEGVPISVREIQLA